MEIVIVWLVLSILVGMYASSKGRSGFGFFLLAALLTPLIGLLIALIVAPGKPDRSGQKRCVYCAEWVNLAAIKCRHCGSDLTTIPTVDEVRHPTAIEQPYRGAAGYGMGAGVGKTIRKFVNIFRL